MSEDYRSFNQDLAIYQIFCSVIFLYLHKISGQNGLSFGTPTHNRLTPKFKGSPGLFMEFFPLQVSLSEEENLSSLHRKVVEETLIYFQNVKPELSTPEVNSKFNVVFNYVNATVANFAGHTVESTYQFSGHNDPRHSLLIQANDYDNSGNIKIQVDLKKELLSTLISDFIPDQFLKCLDAFLNQEKANVSEIEIIGERERVYLLNDLNDTYVDYVQDGTLIDLFQKQVMATPDRISVKYESEELTYSELDNRSNQLARYLVDIQVEPGEVIGLFLHRSIDMVISILAIQKAGAAYLPIDPYFPSKRISYILENSGCQKLISHFKHEQELQSFEIERIFVDYLKEVLSKHPVKSLNCSTENHLAYVIYTSGYTGNPKGVKIQHSAIKNPVLWMKSRYPVTTDDRILQKTPYTFDISVWEFLWPLISGFPMIIAKPYGHKDPKHLRETIIREKNFSYSLRAFYAICLFIRRGFIKMC